MPEYKKHFGAFLADKGYAITRSVSSRALFQYDYPILIVRFIKWTSVVNMAEDSGLIAINIF